MDYATRRSALKQQRLVQKAKAYPAIAPIGGLNTKDAIANMPETDCIICDNFNPQTSWLEFRGGHTTLATFAGVCQTLMGYNAVAANTNEMFGAVQSGSTYSIYRVDNAGGGSAGAAVVGGAGHTVQTLTSAQFDYAQYGSGAVNALVALNGTDTPMVFDGAAWNLTSGGTYAWTGGPSPLSSLRYVGVYKQRLWFIQAGTFNVWYLPQNVLAGSLTEIFLAPNFKLGGYLVSIITVSIDNSAGTNDYIAFLSNVGEIVMFQGYDPSSVSTWSVAAHFRIGAPIGTGRMCWQKVGMDAAVITVDGVVLLSQAMLTDRSQTNAEVSDKIRYGFTQNVMTYGVDFGWQLLLHPATNKLIVNVPTSATIGTSSFAYVQNTLTGAWSTWGALFSSHNAVCWETWANKLYCGTNGTVELCDQPGIADNGVATLCSLKPAFNYMGERTTLKRFTQLQPIWQTNGTLQLAIFLDIDFDPTAPTGTVPTSQANAAPWNTSHWNTTYWGDAQQVVKRWIGLAGVGYCASPYIQTQVNGITGKLQSLVYVYEEGGTFYGR
jgi:hypothetical protein